MMRPDLLRPSTGLLLVGAALVGVACESGGRFDRADAPPAAPVPLGDVVAPRPSETSSSDPARAAECGPTTGRDEDGNCVRLHLQTREWVQRVQIPGGDLVMGHVPQLYDARPTREAPSVRWSGQPPRHARVESFWIDLHEVSRGAYAACVAAGACTQAACPEGQVDPADELSPEIAAMLPRTCVTHEQAAAYCAAEAGRLPTEAEFEMAARGPDARIFPWGNEIIDELPSGLYPVGRMRDDTSYFGILGMGSNATEWVAERYDPDVALRPYLGGQEFRDPAGPSARAQAEYARRAACGDAARCDAPWDPPRHVYKLSLIGARRAAADRPPPHPGPTVEGWEEAAHHPRLGFRCAADLSPGDAPYVVPAATVAIPFSRSEANLRIFGGVAEAVSQAEAARFCGLLTVPIGDGEAQGGWRLPTIAEIGAIAGSFRGPGPFWAADGAVSQDDGTSHPAADAPWQPISAAPDEALAARCVRSE
ncbi:MAG: SUMF1/EgtB/PvdO family nonheme iron enzyme [Nannocystaceae bacterium]